MGFSKVHSGQSDIGKTTIIDIESDLARGLYSFSVVGLPDKGVSEAKDRVGSAIKNSGYESPKSKNHKVVISLAPADIKKEGPAFDLPIALSYLLSSEDIKFDPKNKIFLGELSLNGNIRKINGVLPITIEAKRKGFEEIYVPEENAEEASLVEGIKVFATKSLKEVIDHLDQKRSADERKMERKFIDEYKAPARKKEEREHLADFKDIKGQKNAKRALEIAAAGGHNILMYGPPGTGKSMLAKAFASILPELSYEEILEATSLHSITGVLDSGIISHPPFRAPHHTSSYVSIIGGGNNLKAGEISLAHKGVLFLDEFPEFDRRVIESLREPLEERVIRISRARGSALFPADFILIAAMNPCPCGNFGSEKKRCVCSALMIQKYQRKISGPIIDRIDIFMEVLGADIKTLSGGDEEESSNEIIKRVEKVRGISKDRAKKHKLKETTNGKIHSKAIQKVVDLDTEAKKVLEQASEKLDLSPRSYHRIMRLARTIADLDRKEKVEKEHILEALQYRQKREIV
jgi:magnesium chelatase family protein